MKKLFIIGLLFSTLIYAQELSLSQVTKMATDANSELVSQLKKGLKKAKRKDGLKAMGDFCVDDSKKIVEKLNKKLGNKISIKRISFNNRNKDAKVLENEKNILKAFELIQKSDAYEPKEIVQIIDDNSYKVYFPIKMKSRACKNCHGLDKKVDKDLKKRFFKVYKNNNGYGYKTGEIRGAVVVSISK